MERYVLLTESELQEVIVKSLEQYFAKGRQIIHPEPPITELDDLTLSVRAFNCLKSCKITTVEQLLQHTKVELSKMRHMGDKSLLEILQTLEVNGLKLYGEQ